MFETLTSRLQAVFQDLGRRGKLREKDVESALREIRLALLDADVHYDVVDELLGSVRQRALGAEIPAGLNPAQEVLRIMHESLVSVLGEPAQLRLAGPEPRRIVLAGLQGSGKTTTAAKLAKRLVDQGERVLLVAADQRRPAAVEQLQTLGASLSVPVFAERDRAAPDLARDARQAGLERGASVVIYDTAGRSQLDEPMMSELAAIWQAVEPIESILVADAMTGQEAVRIAEGFAARLPLTGLILTKMDGDARGGAALSMRTVAGVPIKYVGTGESLEALEPFDPERLASRILGMGDLGGLLERAQAAVDARAAEQQAERLQSGEFSLEDFADQLKQVQRLGPLGGLLDMLPSGMTGGLGGRLDPGLVEGQLRRTQAILSSMTPEERRDPQLLNGSRKRRIAAGSGTTVQEVNQLLRQFRGMKKLFKQMGSRGLGNMLTGLR